MLGRGAQVLGFAVVATAGLAFAFPKAARAGEDDLTLDLGGASVELRRIPKGTFSQGSAASEPGHDKDEEGPRAGTITHEMWMGKAPVTRAQFAKFVTDTRYVTEAEKTQLGGYGWDGKQLTQKKEFTWRAPGFVQGEDHPVVLVSFGDAIAFAA